MLAKRASELRNSQRELQLVVEGLAEGVVMANPQGHFQLFNPAAEDILGLGMMEVDPEEWSRTYQIYGPDGETLFPSEQLPLARALRGESTDQIEAISRTPHRGDTWISISGRPIRDDEDDLIGGVVVFADVTERKRFELELQRMAAVDELTSVLNRRGFLDTAERELALALRFRRAAVLLFIDVDGLKRVNDTLGHDEGSQLLADTAAVLTRVARSSDVVGRLGGDEFCLLAVGEPTSAKHAVQQRIQDEIRKHNETAGRPYEVAVSIGAAKFDPEKPESLEDLIAQADGRMYEQKRQRKGA
jgi:diguanylate cyclase (GGDEF)-like protein/PAS domain S-box-containing protein